MERSGEALAAGLLDGQVKAQALFAEIETRNLIRPGAKESEINEGIHTAGRTHVWNCALLAQAHVRAGRNTLAP
jgi:hypothetical protein